MDITTNRPKVLFFDVFGTLVQWRSKVASHLADRCDQALNSNESLAADTRSAAKNISWQQFSEQWRDTYSEFTSSFEPGHSTFKSIDDHYYDSLRKLIKQHGVDGLWSEGEVQDISKIWHFLDAWPDSRQGLVALNSLGFLTSTLSNGNTSLLNDLCEHSSLPFPVVTSAEEFGAYKPDPSVYLGACRKLGFVPSDCCLVAAHLGDLQAARALGLRTIYVERPGEELWSADRVKKAKDEGWVDLWIDFATGGGLKEVAKRFRVEEESGERRRTN